MDIMFREHIILVKFPFNGHAFPLEDVDNEDIVREGGRQAFRHRTKKI